VSGGGCHKEALWNLLCEPTKGAAARGLLWGGPAIEGLNVLWPQKHCTTLGNYLPLSIEDILLRASEKLPIPWAGIDLRWGSHEILMAF